ncbi:MAG: C_GCAxxG_C_C family protein [Clostridia bacterium]|nr:C_GCAxxG_C_C family protein [Clostridia bacterium]
MEITLENITQFPRAEKAMELHKSGFNCAQAVFRAFSDLYPFDEDTAALIAGPLGGGLGGQHEVCGAVSALALVLGMKYGYSDPADKAAKVALYKHVQNCSAQFRNVTGSIICHELLGLTKDNQPKLGERPPQGKIPCRTLVGLCAAILENFMNEAE